MDKLDLIRKLEKFHDELTGAPIDGEMAFLLVKGVKNQKFTDKEFNRANKFSIEQLNLGDVARLLDFCEDLKDFIHYLKTGEETAA